MKRTALVALLLLPALAPAQLYSPTNPPVIGPPPQSGPAALLYVRLDGPAGAKASWYQGQAKRDLDMGAVLGLRPGYVFRFEVNHIPDLPGVSLFPTLEVRGSLSMTTKAQPKDFPAPVVLTREDVQAVLRGALVTKLVYLEHPERATPTATTIQTPIETTLPATRDLYEEAREQGRPVLVIRVGGRQHTPAELAAEFVAGTVLFPGEASLNRPTVAPHLPFVTWPWYDPLAGPGKPDDECIHNGGITPSDLPVPLAARLGRSPAWTSAGLDASGRVIGLQPMDAVAEYRDWRGTARLVPSNRVCLCLPRFQVLRQETPLHEHDLRLAANERIGSKGQDLVRVATPPTPAIGQNLMRSAQGNLRPTEAAGRKAPHAIQRIEILDARALMQGPYQFLGTKAADTLTEVQKALIFQQIKWAVEASATAAPSEKVGLKGTHVIGRVAGLQIIKASAETRSLTACCHEITEVPDCPLLLFKCADKSAAQVGDVVTFTLKYSNQGGKPITDVAVSDSLAARLEYVPGSAESDRAAVFTVQENEAGSQVLRWEIDGVLQAGACGILKFKAKVR